MKSMLVKDTLREIRRSLSRFLSIFFISAIGVSFFAGVKATCPDMKSTADEYFDKYNLYDIEIISTYGIDQDDIDAVHKVEGVEGAQGAYSADVLGNYNGSEYVLKAMSIPDNSLKSDNGDIINQFRLKEGRMPENPGECLGEKGKVLNSGMEIGSTITLTDGNGSSLSSLRYDKYTVVGIVETPYFISFERGTSSIGSGNVDYFMMIPSGDFTSDVFTELYVTLNEAKSADAYSEKYNSIVKDVKDALDTVAEERQDKRFLEIKEKAQSGIDKGQEDLERAKEEADSQLKEAKCNLEDSEKAIKAAEVQVSSKEEQLQKKKATGQAQIDEGISKLEESQEEYLKNFERFNAGKLQALQEIQDAKEKQELLSEQIQQLSSQADVLQAQLQSSSLTEEQRVQLNKQIESAEEQLYAMKQIYENYDGAIKYKEGALSEAEAEFAKSKKVLDETRVQLQQSQSQLNEAVKQGEAELALAKDKITISKEKLQEGYKQYYDKKEELDSKLSEAQEKIDDYKLQMSSLKEPVWYILDRNANYGVVEFCDTADRMDAIAKVFPVFFFFVAALVCLTTMTRMVDEQRGYIGTLKALGYSKGRITFKYLMYAIAASIGGSILGFSIGFKLFPTVIFAAYSIMYILPPIKTPFNWSYALLSTFISAATTTLAAWFACYSELAETPAALMRPRSPKAGKRIWLERVSFLWRKLSFTQKLTARNLFRYKKRLYMTVFGIAGCTALLVTGFGLKDSIISIVSKQFEELYQYQAIIDLKNSIKYDEPCQIVEKLKSDTRIDGYMLIRQQNTEVVSGNNTRDCVLSVPEDSEKLKSYIIFRNRRTREAVPLTDEGAVLTEKLASKLGVKAGDTVYIKDGDTNRIEVKVTGIIENYVQHYIYITPSLYNKLYGHEVEFTKIVAKTSDTSQSFEKQLSEDIIADDQVQSISLTTGITEDFKNTIKSLNYVVLVLIVSAAALAFVVMYNLTNINITERTREIASLKVLGFYDLEVSEYVFRENIFLTLIGITFGLIFGVFLHRFTITTAEVNYVMFGRNIEPLSYVYAAVFTILFSGLVNVVMHQRLKKIEMVESMKSVD